MSEKRCPYCGQSYEPYARAVERQKHCGLSECRRKHKRARDRAWRSNDAEWRQARQVKVREWARERQYWQRWRSKHPEYRGREALRMRCKREKAVAKQDVLLGDPVGYLKRIRYGLQMPGVAKQDVLARRLDEVLEYLIVRERLSAVAQAGVAKQDGADGQRAGAV
jgi:hypothetical protein